MNDKTPIIFTLGEETQPKIEGSGNYAESIFKEQYAKSFDWMTSYLDKVKKAKTNKDEEALRELNNVLAYIGERGSGKTSCMLSVAKILREAPATRNGKGIMLGVTEEFHVLDHIDPSFFDTKHNIVSIIIARLFGLFEKEAKNRRDDANKNDGKHNLLKEFKKVNDNIDLILDKKKEFSEDSLQRIDDLAAAENLRKDIRELITKYLEFFDKKDGFLVIPVDDVDLHTSGAYEMVEQIRKYFVQPNIIILFAVKLDQLSLVIKRQYVDEFGRLLKLKPSPNGNENVLKIDVVDEMVDRYLGKFIPLSQRIYLSDIEGLFDRPLKIEDPLGVAIEYKDKKDVKQRVYPRDFATVREAVPSLIFEKTRYLFYNSSVSTSPIVPRNLRELRHLLYMLCTMDDYWVCYNEEGGSAKYNKALFRKYFFESWTTANLEEQDHDMVKNLLAITDAAIFNKAMVQTLKKRFFMGLKDEMKDLSSRSSPEKDAIQEYEYILRDGNISLNISIGDVMALVRYMDKIVYRSADIRLLFMIKSIYSIRLYEYYDAYTDNPKKYVPKERNDSEIIRYGTFTGISDFEKLIGGSFINSNHSIANILPREKGNGGKERTLRPINIDKLRTLLDDTENIEKHIPLIEFFVLTTSRPASTRDNAANSRYRLATQSQGPYYRQSLGEADSGIFDITSIFFNLLNTKICYDRFDKRLAVKAIQMPNSIRRKLIEATRFREGKPGLKGPELTHRMLSWASIRNVEILEDIIDKLNRLDYKSVKGGNKEILERCFREIAGYRIRTYDKSGTGDHIQIDFAFAGTIANVLRDMDVEDFNSIYETTNAKIIDEAQFDIDLLLKGLFINRNRSSTFIKKINGKYPKLAEIHKDKIRSAFNEEAYSRREIETMLKLLKEDIEAEDVAKEPEKKANV